MITRPEESTECGVSQRDREASITMRPWPTGGAVAWGRRREIRRTCFMQRLVKIGQMVRSQEEECPIGTTLFRQFADFPSRADLSQRPQHISFCFLVVFTHIFHFLRSTAIRSGVQSASCGRTAGQFGNAQLLVRLIFQNVTQQTMSPL